MDLDDLFDEDCPWLTYFVVGAVSGFGMLYLTSIYSC